MGDGLYQQASMGLLPESSAEKRQILERLLESLERLAP